MIISNSYLSSNSPNRMSDELDSTFTSIQEFMAGVSRRLDQIESSHQAIHLVDIGIDETIPYASQTAQTLPLRTSYGIQFHFPNHYETIPLAVIIVPHHLVHTIDDTRLVEQYERLESRMRHIRLQDGGLTWDDRDGILVASLPTKFRMPYIERYNGIGHPKIHLKLYSIIMRANGIDVAQLMAFFPMSLSGASQRWFASIEP